MLIIYPQEIEQVLLQHPLVKDVCVFGVANEQWGEEVRAVVELLDPQGRPGDVVEYENQLTEQLLIFARKQLATYKLPRTIAYSDSLPRSTTGKLYLQRVKQKFGKNH